MLAAIGAMLVGKQAHILLGVSPTAKAPLGLLEELPRSVAIANPAIAAIGGLGLVVLVVWPALRTVRGLGRVPAPLVVLLVTMPLGAVLGLGETRVMAWGSWLGPEHLVRVPAQLSAALTHPDFAPLAEPVFWKHVVLFTVVAGLESLLSAKAIDALDPWGRRASLDRDLVAQGAGNVLAGLLGGLPMISEIARSSANVEYGGRTRLANFFHGLFLLGFVALGPALLQRIPLAALAAMLVYTGARLAHPRELVRAWQEGAAAFAGFVTTVTVTLAVDLLAGIAAGSAVFVLARSVARRRAR
jgi:MFS superfamily sulfate permease-like transporter